MSIFKYFFPKSKINQFNELKNNNFFPLTKSDIILIKSYSLFGKIIRIKSKSDSGHSIYNHAERYFANGRSISQQWNVEIHNIKRFFKGKHSISIWHNDKYTQNQRNTLISNSLIHIGRSYDFLSVLGHFFDWIFRSKYFSKKFNLKHKTNCAEFVTFIERSINSNSSYKSTEETTPDDIFDYISNHPDWKEIYHT